MHPLPAGIAAARRLAVAVRPGTRRVRALLPDLVSGPPQDLVRAVPRVPAGGQSRVLGGGLLPDLVRGLPDVAPG